MVRRFECSGGRRTHHHYTNTTIVVNRSRLSRAASKKKTTTARLDPLACQVLLRSIHGLPPPPKRRRDGWCSERRPPPSQRNTPRPADKSASKANERASRARLRIIDRIVYVRLSDYYFSPALLWHSRQPMMDKGTVNPATGLTFTECPRKRRER